MPPNTSRSILELICFVFACAPAGRTENKAIATPTKTSFRMLSLPLNRGDLPGKIVAAVGGWGNTDFWPNSRVSALTGARGARTTGARRAVGVLLWTKSSGRRLGAHD